MKPYNIFLILELGFPQKQRTMITFWSRVSDFKIKTTILNNVSLFYFKFLLYLIKTLHYFMVSKIENNPFHLNTCEILYIYFTNKGLPREMYLTCNPSRQVQKHFAKQKYTS